MLLEQALELIVDTAPVNDVEDVDLDSCWGRVCSGNNPAVLPVPCYDQSTRDGYVIRAGHQRSNTGDPVFGIRGEIPAGPTGDMRIEPGEAYRIMTGGLVPELADRVIPQERCRVAGDKVIIDRHLLLAPNRFIRRRGSDIAAGDQLVEAGTRLNEVHAARFASSGNRSLKVYRKPRVAFVCSGSELVIGGDFLQPGQKFSSNHYLLKFLIMRHGGIAIDYGLVEDNTDAVESTLKSIIASDADMIISTGGVGPGKYDLFCDILPGLGARILYRSLQVRPGRSTLFAAIGNKLYFGLPGPPSAVHILFHECICPALRKMQGCRTWFSRRTNCFLSHDISLKKADVLCFREGCCSAAAGGFEVRFADRNQIPNCFVLLEPGVKSYKRGDPIAVSMLDP